MGSGTTVSKRRSVLLVDGDPPDVRLIREVVETERTETGADLHVVDDGAEALAYLRRRAESEADPLPDLVLLDPSLPDVDGRELLETIKSDPDLRRIPVIVLSRSEAEADALAFYRRHANAYMCKPDDPDDFEGAIRSLEHFWLSVARLPGRGG